MSTYSIKDVAKSTDRHKIYILMSMPDELPKSISFLQSENIKVLNVGKELANFINLLDDYRFLNIEVYDFTKKLLDKNKSKINGSGNDVIAIFNLGILLEPKLELNVVQLLKEFSKSSTLIIIWENQFDLNNQLNWSTQKQNVFLNFSDIPLKKLQYEI